jgi:hypothetical protein
MGGSPIGGRSAAGWRWGGLPAGLPELGLRAMARLREPWAALEAGAGAARMLLGSGGASAPLLPPLPFSTGGGPQLSWTPPSAAPPAEPAGLPGAPSALALAPPADPAGLPTCASKQGHAHAHTHAQLPAGDACRRPAAAGARRLQGPEAQEEWGLWRRPQLRQQGSCRSLGRLVYAGWC